MIELYDELLGPKAFLPWVRENPIWWMCFRTVYAGHWKKEDVEEFNLAVARYIIFFDHRKNDDACLFALRVIERDKFFKAAKVSKFARDGEKVMVFIGPDASRKQKMTDVCKQMGFILWDVRGKSDDGVTELEKKLHRKYDEYLYCLARAFQGMNPDGAVRVNNIEF